MRKYIITGLLTAIPLWITWLVVNFIFGLITDAGLPIVEWLVGIVKPDHPAIATLIQSVVFRSILAVIVIVVIIYLLGWLATKIIGKRILRKFDALLDKIPMVKNKNPHFIILPMRRSVSSREGSL